MSVPIVTQVEWARLEGRRPRAAGRNARLDEHGSVVRPAIARLTTSDDTTGFGFCRVSQAAAERIVGQPLDALFDPAAGATALGLPFDFPLWDLAARHAGKPVYALAAAMMGKDTPQALRVPCYDTSLYIDDLHLDDDDEAAALIAQEAAEGLANGHRAFKIKVGRGSRHMDLETGTQRDIKVIRAVRAAVGPEMPVMIDANNGYNLNITKRVLAETAECRLHWVEEAFHEDRVLYEDLRGWMQAEGLATLIADGEGEASPSLLAWAEVGVVDVVQYDIFSYGFTPWLQLGQRLDDWHVQTAPHHYGGHYGNYAACHLAPSIARFAFVEWDEATTPGLIAVGYRVEEGSVVVPDIPGFGVALDDALFAQAVQENGYRCTLG
jgi:L-rhamnonate dehydratase